MLLFLWKKNYEIGIAKIVTQLRNLVGIINGLSDAMMNKKGYVIVTYILEELEDYIQFHFTTEEEIMRHTKYPALDEHCQEPLAMTTKVAEFKRNYAKNHETDAERTIVVSDKKLRAHIQTMEA